MIEGRKMMRKGKWKRIRDKRKRIKENKMMLIEKRRRIKENRMMKMENNKMIKENKNKMTIKKYPNKISKKPNKKNKMP